MPSNSTTSDRLTVRWDESAGRRQTLVLDGQIDERAALSELTAQVEGEVVIDLAGVSFINSIGVRKWIELLHALQRRGVKVTLRRCSEALVQQMNTIVEAQAGATVESFFAPYECSHCGKEASMQLDVGEHRAELLRFQAPELPCPECGEDMTFTELTERYLGFLSNDTARGEASGA